MVTIENYKDKVLLFMRVSKNRHMANMFAKKVMVDKLQHELEKLVPSEKRIIIKKPVAKSPEPVRKRSVKVVVDPAKESPIKTKVVRTDHEVRYDDLPKHLQICWDQNRDDYKTMRSYHEKLKLMEKASDHDRKVLVSQIISMEESIRERWKKIDGYDPSKAGKIDYKRIQANRKYISKALSEIREGKSPEKILITLQERVDELITANVPLADKTIAELKKLKIKT